jgi:hypothetical protein
MRTQTFHARDIFRRSCCGPNEELRRSLPITDRNRGGGPSSRQPASRRTRLMPGRTTSGIGPSVWTGPRVASRKVMIWRSWSCASVSGLLMEPLSSWPSWISARARSHSRLGPEGHTGHLITNALAKPFSISSFRLADLGGKANSTIVLGASLSVSHSPGECFRLPPS